MLLIICTCTAHKVFLGDDVLERLQDENRWTLCSNKLKCSCRCSVKLQLLDAPALIALLTGLPEEHLPLAWAQAEAEMPNQTQGSESASSASPDVAQKDTVDDAQEIVRVILTITKPSSHGHDHAS